MVLAIQEAAAPVKAFAGWADILIPTPRDFPGLAMHLCAFTCACRYGDESCVTLHHAVM